MVPTWLASLAIMSSGSTPGIIFACLYFNVSAAEEATAESESAMTEMAERSFMVMM